MTKLESHGLASGLLDLPLLDRDGKYCGIVDDVELDGGPGEALRIHALMVGPGAYSGRLPGWAMTVVRLLAGDHVVRIPWDEVHDVTSAVRLRRAASDHGLQRVENRVRGWIPRKGAL